MPNPALNLVPFGRWTLRDKAAQRRLAPRWASHKGTDDSLAMGALARPGSPLAAIAARYNASPAQVALAWLLAVSSQTILIPGTSSIAHLEENYAARTLRLKPEEIAAIREAAQQDAPGDAPKAARP